MCNLYSLTKGQAAIREWFRAGHDRTGNLPLFPGIFPDQMAPIVRTGEDGERELVMARWGMPGPPQYGGAPITTFAMSQARIGEDGLIGETAASFLPRCFASTRTPSLARPRCGLH
jgi:putative SOS response-associated peptidase YedK